MHLAVAQAAEKSAWLAAAKHYALADAPGDAMRVLGSAASEALGTGAWGSAVEVIGLMPDTPPPPAVEVIKARALISGGRPREALGLLERIDRGRLDPEGRALVGLTCAAAYHLEGEGRLLSREVQAVARDVAVPSPLREVAVSWQQMLLACKGGLISDVVELLRQLAVKQRAAGLRFFAGITLHNAANAELARGNYGEASRLADEAIGQLSQTDDGGWIVASTRSILAASTAESGQLAEGLRAATDRGCHRGGGIHELRLWPSAASEIADREVRARGRPVVSRTVLPLAGLPCTHSIARLRGRPNISQGCLARPHAD
jgi:hypothetical protein